jgi:hypothetical protein
MAYPLAGDAEASPLRTDHCPLVILVLSDFAHFIWFLFVYSEIMLIFAVEIANA